MTGQVSKLSSLKRTTTGVSRKRHPQQLITVPHIPSLPKKPLKRKPSPQSPILLRQQLWTERQLRVLPKQTPNSPKNSRGPKNVLSKHSRRLPNCPPPPLGNHSVNATRTQRTSAHQTGTTVGLTDTCVNTQVHAAQPQLRAIKSMPLLESLLEDARTKKRIGSSVLLVLKTDMMPPSQTKCVMFVYLQMITIVTVVPYQIITMLV